MLKKIFLPERFATFVNDRVTSPTHAQRWKNDYRRFPTFPPKWENARRVLAKMSWCDGTLRSMLNNNSWFLTLTVQVD